MPEGLVDKTGPRIRRLGHPGRPAPPLPLAQNYRGSRTDLQREFHLVHWLAAHLKLPGTRPGHLGVLRGPVLASNVKLPGTRPGHFEKRRLDSLLSPRSRAEK